MRHFSLLYDSWIPCVTKGGTTIHLGLVDVIRRADDLRWIQAEAPVVTAALHRLLIAFAHRALDGPKSEAQWRELWDAPSFPAAGDTFTRIETYATRWAQRFWLSGTDHPFMQCPAIPDEKLGSPAQLILGKATGGNATLFDHTISSASVEIPADQAARWLVTVQAFDTGGLKTPYTKDKTSRRGPCNQFGVAVLQGKDLKETLLLNLVDYAPGARLPGGTREDDRPIWEQSPPTPEPENPGRAPLGWTELLTWPARRIRLLVTERDGKPMVRKAAILPGTRHRGDLRADEKMGAFRSTPTKTSRNDDQRPDRWQPVQVEELRGIWPHAVEFLLSGTATRQRPATIDEAAERLTDDHERTFTLRVFGQQLDSNGGAVEAWFEETLPAPVSLLRVRGPARSLEVLLGAAVKLANNAGKELRDLETRYTRGLSADAPSPLLGIWYWPALPAPFRRLLHELGRLVPAEDTHSEELPPEVRPLFLKWGETVRSSALTAGERWVWNNPSGSGRQIMALADTENTFRSRMSSLLEKYEKEIEDYS
ncbi:type I-E CRISPR-associated protein Cse1/CasA [Spiractinospora alimapuensis]|uniref:type I-E CRISPR-associated protein Cse1/CasA n=1 Tax=Spiractinospora alimapuensis TaxID=2820884 RepID=UPI001F4399A5|nr:type I-E CRISPR-associated protein Cse1/CasA [Spiractinospora alimapuensis]QVQ51592.1 type I-E CRISPR-associated protein Cse1/CasA [Spiractinospora alimapuensis]